MKNLRGRTTGVALALLAALAIPAFGQEGVPGKVDPDGIKASDIPKIFPEYFTPSGDRRAGRFDIPDVFGPGAVLDVGNVFMKVTNFGHCGNFFTNLSSDPAGQWPGASGIEYLSTIRLAVGAVNPEATDPTAIRRVSYLFEWRPPTLDPVDKIYRAYDGIINGARFVNDDGDGPDRLGYFGPDYIDEDFLDGRDNDGDGKIDEDFGAVGQKMFSCVMRDDTPEAINATFNEKHVPLGLECRQLAWAYSIPGFQDFDVIEYNIYNRSGHELDSLTIGWLVDMDAGPVAISNYYADDFDLPFYPHGEFHIPMDVNDARLQTKHDPGLDGTQRAAPSGGGTIQPGTPLCQYLNIRVNGFSIASSTDDNGRTTGIPSFLLINHTIDPLGVSGPWRVGFRSYRSFTAGTPYVQGGNPIIDQQRYEMMTAVKPDGNVDYSDDPKDAFVTDGTAPTGWITQAPGDQKGDYVAWCSTGPWRHVPPGGKIQATVAFAVAKGRYSDAVKYPSDFLQYQAGIMTADVLRSKYPSLDNAITAQIAYEGVWELRNTYPQTDYHGRETNLIAPLGSLGFPVTEDCFDARGSSPRTVIVQSDKYYWFDFDCDYCTGVYDWTTKQGLFHKTWNAEAPPPNPNTNLATKYNYTDNPNRTVAPEGDRQITIAWDNLSEATPDPKSRWFDARGYKIWKVANWQRPVGSPGPGEDDWSLVGEFRRFDYRRNDGSPIPNNLYVDSTTHNTVCPLVYIPNARDANGNIRPDTMRICLNRGDLWDRQTGLVIRPDSSIKCTPKSATDPSCAIEVACRLGSSPCLPDTAKHYAVGRYRFVDTQVKDGFLYFYSVTAFDSTGDPRTHTLSELEGRRSAVEAEGVSPQAATRTGKQVWVVPNPYRGYQTIAQRPSAWDLTPNATDPTGTHIDFMGLPPGAWTIKIYTVAGDLVQTIKSTDSVNESIRPPISDDNNVTRPGYNRQQDTANDGEASWNLISRNGQDIVSGIYLFTVQSSQGTQRGKFVVIR